MAPQMQQLKSVKIQAWNLRVGETQLVEFLDKLPTVSKLETLTIQVSITSQDAIASRISSLQHLNLNGSTGIGDGVIASIVTSCRNLETLRISSGDITNASVIDIATRSSITVVDLSYCKITDNAIAKLAKNVNKKLLRIRLKGCSLLTIESTRVLKKHCPNALVYWCKS
jgi:hypothetical protein